MLGLVSYLGFLGILGLVMRMIRTNDRQQRADSNAAAAMLSARYQ